MDLQISSTIVEYVDIEFELAADVWIKDDET
jgi:hypothetical protein